MIIKKETKKAQLGQFFTKGNWASTFVKELIAKHVSKETGTMDPFAGGGDLALDGYPFKGYDIDPSLGWEVNDGLQSIPAFNGVLLTNPPYLAKNSATRQGLYFPKDSKHDDMYKIALDKCRESCDKVIAIVPESLIVSSYLKGVDFSFIDAIEENPFEETECPVCVVGFGFPEYDRDIFKNGEYIGKREDLVGSKPKFQKTVEITSHASDSNYMMRCIDGQKDEDRMRLEKVIPGRKPKTSDRAIVGFKVDGEVDIEKVNKQIESVRKKTKDIAFKPFKGNNKSGSRRRCMTIADAKAFIEGGL